MICKDEKFGNLVSIVSEKIDTEDVDIFDYISTENMQPNLGGVGIVSQMPNTKKVNAYKCTDTLFSNIRTYFRKVWYAEKDGGLSADVLVFRTKNAKKLLPQYLYYLVANEDFTKYSVRTSRGVKMPRGDKDALLEYPVSLPSISRQMKVCSLLSAIDDKIANNKAMNQTLEKLAQRIFKSWFIDFDPVKANKEGLPFDGLSPEIQALFPSEFEDSELGMIPKGWEVTPLSKVVKLTGGGTPKRSETSYWNGEIPWFSMKDAPENGEVFVIDTEEKITELGLQKSSTKLLPRGTTIITARGTVGKLALVATDMCMNQSCYGVRGTEVGDYFNYFNLKQAISTLKQNVHGAVFDTITTNTFDTYSFAFSGSEIANAYNELIAPLLEKSEINARQNITLTRLRDRLLPKLVSGQISVGEAAQELAEAV